MDFFGSSILVGFSTVAQYTVKKHLLVLWNTSFYGGAFSLCMLLSFFQVCLTKVSKGKFSIVVLI